MSERDFQYILFGYLSGSILFARLWGILLHKNITAGSRDHNPGTANAFLYGGFWCGLLTLCGDLLKGFLPVYLYLYETEPSYSAALSFVMAAPVLGHIIPIFCPFHGGKGIAVSFGCLLGLFPEMGPVCILAGVFLFFSLIIKITPHYYRTLITYVVSTIAMFFKQQQFTSGFFLITGIIIIKLLLSKEEKEHLHLEALWKH